MLRVKFAVAWETRGFCEALNARSDDTKKQAARALANLAVNEVIREQIASLDLGSILKGMGGVMKGANVPYDAKQLCYTCA